MANITIQSAKSHPIFLQTLRDLITNRFYSENNLEENKISIQSENLEFSTWLASIISTSNEEDDKLLASTFAILLFLENKTNVGLVKSSYVILSRSGNLIASRFFDDIFEYKTENTVEERELVGFKTHFSTVLNYELGLKLSTNEIKAGDLNFIGSDYQKSLWKSLNKTENNLAISAPTSAGKSYVIQNYLKKIFQDREKLFGIYIVPTRALIAQVSERLKAIFPQNVSINTAFVENEDLEVNQTQFDDKHIFIVTPERCLKLIQYSYKERFQPDFIFIDEIQNIESKDGRGFLFEYLLNEIKIQWPATRIILAGPFLDSPEILFQQIFQNLGEKKQTMFSPVFQLKVSLKPSTENREQLIANIHFRGEVINTITIPLGFDIRELTKKSIGKALIEIVHHFGKGTKNIVYVPRTDYAEYYALQLSQKIDSDAQQLDFEVSDLIELVKEEVHSAYYLIDALKAKSAFHHGKLPEILRGEIEYLFSTGKLDNLICTATLMEGVNLPAQKVFVASPKKDNIELTSFEFGNIIGRAGRIRDSLVGSIYCLQREDENWAQERYNANPEKQIEPAIYKVLSIPTDELRQVLLAPLDNPSREYEYAGCFLKHKYLKGDQAFHDYLLQKNVTEDTINLLSADLLQRLSNLTIPGDLLRFNPSIDPELQDVLYKRIITEGIETWVIHDNGKLFQRMTKEVGLSTPHTQNNLFGQLRTILLKLDSIFDFNKEAFYKHQISRTVPQMILYAVKWMQNSSMNELIRSEIHFYGRIRKLIDPENRKEVNTLINDVIKVYSTVVSFILVKYLKLLTDILNVILNEEQKEKHKFTMSLPIMLELGTQNAVVLLLISKGITRSVAIKLHKLIPEQHHADPFAWLKEQENINLSPVYIRYLRRKKIIK